MRHIIILLTSLFLVSNASAEDVDKTMKDVCKYYEEEITTYYQDIEEAKTYHYLDCSDFRR